VGTSAEIADEYIGKGDPVLIEGRLKLDSWETDGSKRSKLRVVAERMRMLGQKKSGQANAEPEPAAAETAATY
jgi:single-strand DNA-binding protein